MALPITTPSSHPLTERSRRFQNTLQSRQRKCSRLFSSIMPQRNSSQQDESSRARLSQQRSRTRPLAAFHNASARSLVLEDSPLTSTRELLLLISSALTVSFTASTRSFCRPPKSSIS